MCVPSHQLIHNPVYFVPLFLAASQKLVYPAKYYNGPWECVRDIVKTQGIKGLYKGYWTMFIR